MPQLTAAPAVSMRGIVKAFGQNMVLRGVDFEVRAGEVHALLGENGAGKSTLMKVLMGVHRPDQGSVEIGGEPVSGDTTRQRLDAGVSMIFQELSLVPALTVADNLFLGREPRAFGGRILRGAVRDGAARAIQQYGFDLDPSAVIKDMPFAARQQVEILKALSRGASVIVMDEPTSSLTVREEQALHAQIRKLKADGIGVVYISHRMSEIFRIADRLSVIKDGQMHGPFAIGSITIPEIARLMSRSDQAGSAERRNPAARSAGATVLSVAGLSTERKLRDVAFEVRAGEVVGIAGLVGSGRSTLLKAVFGLLPDAKGQIELAGTALSGVSTEGRVRAGLALVPEDRRAEGLVGQHSLQANVALPSLATLMGSLPGVVSRRREAALFQHYRQALSIVCREPAQEAAELSGGNQQKIVFSKWLATKPRLLMLDEPTAGVDINAKGEMRALIRNAADEGMAVLLVTSELDELAALSDRILYLVDGRLAPVTAEGRGEEEIRTILQNIAMTREAA